MPTYRSLLLSLALLGLTACSNPESQTEPPEPKMSEVIQTFKQVEQKVKDRSINQKNYSVLIVNVDIATTQIPTDTPPRVVNLLNGSVEAYKLALRYWQCEQESPGTHQATCRDNELEKVMAKFPYIRRNITQRLILRPNPPLHISSVISTQNMLQLLLMQAELNRVDAHLILTGGNFDEIYSS
jgi:hypothetical protein